MDQGETEDARRVDLRVLGSGEAGPLQRVFEAAGDHFLRMTGKPAPDPDTAEREIRSAEATPGREVALVVARGTQEGVGALGWWAGHPEADLALLGMLVVVPEERGKGLAREALGSLEERLRTEGIRRLRTGVGAGDGAAATLLRALGFAPLEQRAHVAMDQGRMRIALFEKPI